MHLLPKDQTPEEVMIAQALAVNVYQKLDDISDKFIVAMVFDMGYSREDTARALGMSYVTLYSRIKEIRRKLKRRYEFGYEKEPEQDDFKE